MKELIINKEDLLFNINKIINNVPNNDYTIIAVVKGNGYGLGIIPYTKFLAQNNIHFFAVADFEEAIKLRQAGIDEKLMVLTPLIDEDDVEILIKNDVVLTIDSNISAKIANNIAKKLNKQITAHIKIDTGLSRFGFNYSDTTKIANIIKECDHIDFEGIFSHLSNSLAADSSFSNKQFNNFMQVVTNLENLNITFKLKHICNSSGFFKYPNMHLNAARIGSAFIGNAYGPRKFLKKNWNIPC